MGMELGSLAHLGCVLALAACGSVKSNTVGQDAGMDAMSDAGIDAPNPDGGTPAPPLPSCAALPSTCGSAHNVSCCDNPAVPGGTYFRSYDAAGDSGSGTMSDPATISAFHLDRFEVTVGRFRAFVAAGLGTQANPPVASAGAHKNLPASGWDTGWNASLTTNLTALIAAVKCSSLQTWTDNAGNNENRPINCVTWYEAMAFCIWDGGYLPTEAEWNDAATGGNEQRAYPWSSPAGSTAIDGAHASYLSGTDCIGDGMPGCTVSDLVVAGSKPLGEGKWGHSELAGNVAEWVLDWIDNYPANCVDCATLTGGPNRVTRGGAFDDPSDDARSAFRIGAPPATRSTTLGFRCARP
jgi:formylglycine-generating enzyme required for sulfatase activity